MVRSVIEPGVNLGYSDIYIDFLNREGKATRFYYSSDINRVAEKLDEILYNRDKLVNILLKQNKVYNSSQNTIANIKRLKNPKAVCVFAGQQACLFGGPFLVVLKALAITKAAKIYEEKLNRPVIPIFWIAGDDHDFEEANHTFILDKNSDSQKVSYNTAPQLKIPTSEIKFSNEIELHQVKQNLKNTIEQSDFTSELYDLIESSYTTDDTMVTAFGKFMAGLTKNLGLIFFNPSDPEAKRIAQPFFKELLEKQDELHKQVNKTNKEIIFQGYHLQVEKKANAAYLFYNCEERTPVFLEENHYKVGDRTFTKDELLECVEKHPERFSPDVMTRPVMQSFLFPVLSQKGGPAEIAYLAQINPIFELFGLIPPYHKGRASATLVEKRFEKTIEEYDITFEELTGDIEQVINRIMEKSFPEDLDIKFNELRNSVKEKFKEFSRNSLQFDMSLEKYSEQIMGKIDYNFNAFEKKLFSSHKKKSQQTRDKIYKLWHTLYTNRVLQERSLNITYFLAKYGLGFVDKLYDALDSEEKSHQIIKVTEII